jgi:hypothetical protein
MYNNEWRIILVRVRVLSFFVGAIAVGYFFFTPTASERFLAVVFVLGALVAVGLSWRKLRSMEE